MMFMQLLFMCVCVCIYMHMYICKMYVHTCVYIGVVGCISFVGCRQYHTHDIYTHISYIHMYPCVCIGWCVCVYVRVRVRVRVRVCVCPVFSVERIQGC